MWKTDTSPLANERMADTVTPDAGFVIVGNPGGRRVELFQAALSAADRPPARVVAWADLLARRVDLADVVRPGDVVRLESPGRDFEVERALLVAGASEIDEDDLLEKRYARADRKTVEGLAFNKGRILWPRQWYLGFRAALWKVAAQLKGCPPYCAMNAPEDILVMFDKVRCHQRLSAAGVAVPDALDSPCGADAGPTAIHSVCGFDDLTYRMRQAGWRRVFVKLAHGSSASGVVAYQTGGADRHQAITTVEMVRHDGELRLYNSRRIRTYTEPRQIAQLIDALARHRIHVEQWLPKAGYDGRVFDLRVLVVAGRARHVVVRLSRSPMTNLHLLNDRCEPDGVRRRMGEAAWSAAMAECERAMKCFPASLHGGIDLLIASGFRRHAVLEVNAFGDLLPGALSEGVGTYEAEIAAHDSLSPVLRGEGRGEGRK